MANQVYSPGVYTSEKDISFTTETVGVTTLGLVGETQKGPAFQPMFIRNYDEFSVMFGGTSPEKFQGTQIVKYELPYIAKSYLTQSNQLFVNRVLGLSGYNAGMAYVLRTIGAIDQTTLGSTGSTVNLPFRVHLTGTTAGTFYYSTGTTELIDQIATTTGVDSADFETSYLNFFNINSYTTKNWYKNNVLYWGIVNSAAQSTIRTDRSTHALTTTGSTAAFIDAYELPTTVDVEDEASYILANEFSYNENTDRYSGKAFAGYAFSVSSVSAGVISGTFRLTTYNQRATPNMAFHKKVAGTLRSRGTYVADALKFNITGSTTVQLTNTAAVQANPFAAFTITGTTSTNRNFSYTVSLDSTQTNYIKKVLGSSSNDKNTNLFVEELYTNSINRGWNYGQIKGLHFDLLKVNDWAHYEFQYQSPMTPFFVSELRGGVPDRLFRLVSISDGNSANVEIKASIVNVSLDNLTFDLVIRDFNDSDRNPVILERYIGLSMDEKSTKYVGRLIGTIDNKYPLLSSYVVVDVDPNAPADAVPCGFEGYTFRTNGTTESDASFAGVVNMPYKTKYYNPGDLIVDPPFSTPIYSVGDKVKKVYLGFTDTEYGYDADLLSFKGQISLGGDNTYNNGEPWSENTTGFHMDVEAGTIVDTNGAYVFSAGISGFTDAVAIISDPLHPYHDIKTRKFTALFAGGYDGWDIYRASRTNTDDYKIGRTGFIRSGFTTFSSAEFSLEFGDFGISDYYATYMGVLGYQNPEDTTINILATPGIDIINNSQLVADTIEIVEEKRMDTMYLPTLPDIQLLDNSDPSDTTNWFYPSDIVDQLAATDIDSNYTAVYYPWIQINDSENNANVFIPPTSEIVRNLAYTDNVAFPWFATAGYNRGIVNCIRARHKIDQTAKDILYPGRINPIVTFSDIGPAIFGNKNMQVADSLLNRLNIRRLLLQARKLIVAVSNRILFDPDDDTLVSQWLSLVNPILDNIRKERGLFDFRIKIDTTPADLDQNRMVGRIFLKPVPALEEIDLTFVVTPNSVSFDNVT